MRTGAESPGVPGSCGWLLLGLPPPPISSISTATTSLASRVVRSRSALVTKEVLSDTLPSCDINLTLFPLAVANDHIYTNAPLSRPISEVKRVRARLVRTWGTSLESRGVVGKLLFFFFLFFCHF